MRLSLGLEARQVQIQKLAPRMIQSMEILQLPIMALQERIEQEMNENPLLEIQEQDPALPDEPEERDNPDAPADSERELVVDESKDNVDDFERLLNLDKEVPTTLTTGLAQPDADGGRGRSQARCDGQRRRSSRIAERLPDAPDRGIGAGARTGGHGRADHLRTRRPRRRVLEDRAWRTCCRPTPGPEQLELARKALQIVQSLDPPGIAARDLRECLLLQLTPDMPYYDELKTLISSHLEDLRDNRLPQIERKTGYSIERIQEAWEQLRKLNPKPGAMFAETFVPTVTPDVMLEQADDGSYKVVLEDTRTPRLFISEYYRRRLMSGQATPEEKEFIKRKINSAQWLIDSIEQRRSTLTRVAQAIVDHQKQFLDDGPEFIVPLKMQQIADTVGVHVTTVSRAVDDKWIQTPRGMFPLKRFFVGGTRSDDGDDVAWDRDPHQAAGTGRQGRQTPSATATTIWCTN